jgi:hypothetical protein
MLLQLDAPPEVTSTSITEWAPEDIPAHIDLQHDLNRSSQKCTRRVPLQAQREGTPCIGGVEAAIIVQARVPSVLGDRVQHQKSPSRP